MVEKGVIPSNINALCSDVVFPLFIEPEELEHNGRLCNPDKSESKIGHWAVMKVSLTSDTVNLYDSQKDHYSKESIDVIRTIGQNLGVAMRKTKDSTETSFQFKIQNCSQQSGQTDCGPLALDNIQMLVKSNQVVNMSYGNDNSTDGLRMMQSYNMKHQDIEQDNFEIIKNNRGPKRRLEFLEE